MYPSSIWLAVKSCDTEYKKNLVSTQIRCASRWEKLTSYRVVYHAYEASHVSAASRECTSRAQWCSMLRQLRSLKSIFSSCEWSVESKGGLIDVIGFDQWPFGLHCRFRYDENFIRQVTYDVALGGYRSSS